MADPAKMKICYVVEKNKEGKSFWHRIGVAFVNQDGSLSVKLQALPMGGEMQIRDYQPREGQRPTSPYASSAAPLPAGAVETPPAEDNIPF